MSDMMTAGCPVCPFENLGDDAMRCPQCGTDLSALRRVRRLSALLLETGEEMIDREPRSAIAYLSPAALVARTRGRALLLLGECHARLGDRTAAVACWVAAAEEADQEEEARLRINTLPQEDLASVVRDAVASLARRSSTTSRRSEMRAALRRRRPSNFKRDTTSTRWP